MATCRQLRLLLWKNMKLKLRQPVTFAAELLIPLLCALFLVLVRSTVYVNVVNKETTYRPAPLTPPTSFSEEDAVIYYTPETEATQLVMDLFQKTLLKKYKRQKIKMQGFQEKNETLTKMVESNRVAFIIEFRGQDGESVAGRAIPTHLQFTIRPRVKWHHLGTDMVYPYPPHNMPPCNIGDTLGLAGLQYLLVQALTRYWAIQDGRDPWMKTFGVSTQCLPFPAYQEDPMVLILEKSFDGYLITSFLISSIMFTKAIVFEKEFKLKETMKMVGLKKSIYWLSWFIFFCLYFVPVLAGYTALITGALYKGVWPVVRRVEPSLFFAFLLCYGLALITFSFMVSAFVQKGWLVGWLVGWLIGWLVGWEGGGSSPCCFRLPAVLRPGTDYLLLHGQSVYANIIISIGHPLGEGTTWKNYDWPPYPEDNFSLKDCMIMMLVDSVLHCVVAWYVEHLRPGEFGVAKPPWFCCKMSYWFPVEQGSVGDQPKHPSGKDQAFQEEHHGVKPEVKIINLRKVFDGKPAVKCTNLSIYKDEIFVLMGHNGCGKSVTLGMMTGFLAPSSGTVIIKGLDIRHKLEAAREHLGVCPQFNILFQKLTVREHFSFFAQLKGISGEELKKEISDVATEMDLQQKLDARASDLSVGYQRRLSVGIALIGKPEILILDEPTSSMDPKARRDTWHLLKKLRKGRAIIMTTHFMDEADLLGDRVAIMDKGEVKCCGNPEFLKDVFRLGYHLVITVGPHCRMLEVMEEVQIHVKEARFESAMDNKATVTLPLEAKDKIPDLFKDLHSHKEWLDIASFGISTPSIEDVFLALHKIRGNVTESTEVNSFLHRKESLRSKGQGRLCSLPRLHKIRGNVTESTEVNSFLHRKESLRSKSQGRLCSSKQYQLETITARETGMRRLKQLTLTLLEKKRIYIWSHLYLFLAQLVLPVPIIMGLSFFTGTHHLWAIQEPARTYDLEGFRALRVYYSPGRSKMLQHERLTDLYAKQFYSSQSKIYLRRLDFNWDAGFNEFILEQIRRNGLQDVLFFSVMGMEVFPISSDAESVNAIAHYSPYPLHARQISVNYVLNAMLQYLLNDSFSVQTRVAPLPKEPALKAKGSLAEVHIIAVDIAMRVAVGMSCSTVLMFHFLILEKTVSVKHLQLLSGAGAFAYWSTTFILDIIIYMLGSGLALFALLISSEEAHDAFFGPGANWKYLVPALAVNGWASLGSLYAMHNLFDAPGWGAVFIIVFNVMTGVITLKLLLMMKLMYLFGLANLHAAAWLIDSVSALLFPIFSLASCFKYVFINYHSLQVCPRQQCRGIYSPCCPESCDTYICIKTQHNYLSLGEPGIGFYILCMAVQGSACMALVVLMDYHVLNKLWYRLKSYLLGSSIYKPEFIFGADDDVAEERQRILEKPEDYYLSDSKDSDGDVATMVNLYKCYGTSIAVDHLCLGVARGDCFLLLGHNGAGKTTIFKMLSGYLSITEGDAFVMGHSAVKDIAKVQSMVGYSPQTGGLLLHMTARQTLTMHARLRGLPEDVVPDRVNTLMKLLLMDSLADIPASKYSGGNRRKLITAISLVEQSPLLLLDEPSHGMDPLARRHLWDVLITLRDRGSTLILASHRTSECEHMGKRAGVLVNGQLACLGTVDHLKRKFGKGFTFIVHLQHQDGMGTLSTDALIQHILGSVEGCQVHISLLLSASSSLSVLIS
ncbi:hypothetical protein EGW08_014003 [Elysia chlorotica]|uniref:ABC transporter domain-containing protein n=1 Tax=Elysia chlorotica TaxID=188477 RepID=A0A3S1B9E7_ELYCH|nr:hypothetical protein EGW08_014003 [Elysia chlorotica]